MFYKLMTTVGLLAILRFVNAVKKAERRQGELYVSDLLPAVALTRAGGASPNFPDKT